MELPDYTIRNLNVASVSGLGLAIQGEWAGPAIQSRDSLCTSTLFVHNIRIHFSVIVTLFVSISPYTLTATYVPHTLHTHTSHTLHTHFTHTSQMMSSESRMVLQFQFTRWPDYGVPKLAAPLLNFLRAVNTSNPSGAGPVIIHCRYCRYLQSQVTMMMLELA